MLSHILYFCLCSLSQRDINNVSSNLEGDDPTRLHREVVGNVNWREMYFRRFGRTEKLDILWSNYLATQKTEYLKQIMQV